MGRGKKRRVAKNRAKQERRRTIRIKMGKKIFFTLTHCYKKLVGLSNHYNYKANMHKLIYKDASFTNVRYQASILTQCNFSNAHLTGVDFFNSNLRGTSFKGATLKDVVFFNCNLKDASFENVHFSRVSFICTNTTVLKNFVPDEHCTLYTTYPKIEIDKTVEQELLDLSSYGLIYKYKVLHVNRQKLNFWCIQILLDCYGNKTYSALCNLAQSKNDRWNLYTIFSYRKLIERQIHL